MSIVPVTPQNQIINRQNTVRNAAQVARTLWSNRGTIQAGYNRLSDMVRSTRRTNYAARRIQRGFRGSRNRRKSVRSGAGVTFQHDSTGIYRKSYMPKYKKRRWKRFTKKVSAVSEKELGSQTRLFNSTITASNSANNDSGQVTLALYSQKSIKAHLNDIQNIHADLNTGDPTALTGTTKYNSTKIIYKSGVLDMTIRNTSFFTDESDAKDLTLEVDIYAMAMKKPARLVTTLVDDELNDFKELYKDADSETNRINGSGNKLTDDGQFRRGVTPFEFPYATSKYGLKIIKKSKYFLTNGQTMTYQCRDAKRHVLNLDYHGEGFNKPGVTKLFFVIFKAIPGFVRGTGPGQITEQLTIGSTRKYMYNIRGVNDVRDEFNAQTVTA